MEMSRAEAVAARLRDAIGDGAFELGERLSEESLSEVLGVSRTPVREALRQLRAEGLVHVVPKSGTYIFRPELQEIRELCECRLGLELTAVELALTRDRAALLDDLTRISSAMSHELAASDIRAYNRLDAEFHLALLRHCGNRYLLSSYRSIHASICALRAHMASRAEGALDASMAEHRELIRLLSDGDVTRAGDVLRSHVGRAEANYLASLAQQRSDARQSKQEQLRVKLALAPEANPEATPPR